jgi:hypothetical protein
LPWPNYFESRQNYENLNRELRENNPTFIKIGKEIESWAQYSQIKPPNLRSSYSDEVSIASAPCSTLYKAYLEQGENYINYGTMDIFTLSRKAGLTGGMYEATENTGRQPGILYMGLKRDKDIVWSDFTIYRYGDKRPIKLIYDLIAFDRTFVVMEAKKSNGEIQRVVDILEQYPARYKDSICYNEEDWLAYTQACTLSFRIENVDWSTDALVTMLNSKYNDNYFARSEIYNNQLYQTWCDTGKVIRTQQRNPFVNPLQYWPYAIHLNIDSVYLYPPTNLTGQIDYMNQKITLNWQDKSQENQGYSVWRSVNGSEFTKLIDLPYPNTTGYDDFDIDIGPNNYSYFVQAYYVVHDIFYYSDPSNEITVGVLGSSFIGMTAYNNTSRIVYGGGKLHLAYTGTIYDEFWYETVSCIYYTFSTDNGISWSTPETVPWSKGAAYPSLALNSSNEPYIFFANWLYYEGWNMHGVMCIKDGSNNWFVDTTFQGAGSVERPTGRPSGMFMYHDSAFVVMQTGGAIWCWSYRPDRTVPSTGRKFNVLGYLLPVNCSLLTVTVDCSERIIVSYINDEDNQIYLKYKDLNNPNWSDGLLVPSISYLKDYSIAVDGSNLYIAQGKYDYLSVYKGKRNLSGGYSWSNEFSYNTPNPLGWFSTSPVIIDNGRCVVWCTTSENDAIFYSIWDGNSWSEPKAMLTVAADYRIIHPQACIAGNIGLNRLLYAVWTNGFSDLADAPYWVSCASIKYPVWRVPNDNATGPNNAELLVVDEASGNIQMVFNTGTTIEYSVSTDNGNTWGDFVTVNSGSHPSIALDSSGLPRINYLKNDTVFCQTLKPDSTWDTIVIYGNYQSGKPKEPAVAPSYPPELANYSYSTFSTTDDPMGVNSKINFSIFDVTEDIAPSPNEVASGENLNSPSIAITPGDYVHIVWEQKGDIYYRTSLQPLDPGQEIVWSDIFNVSGSPMVYSEHPVVEAYGENIIVAWKEGNPGEIYRRIRNINSDIADWLEIENISQSSTQESDYPVLSTQDVVAWQEQIDSLNYEIYAWIQGDIINISETENSSKYPHIAVEPQDFTGDTITPAIVINAIWTETVIPDSLYEVRFRRYEHTQGADGISGMIEYISVSVGDSLASPYCKKRDGFIQYGEYALDYSRSSLIYNLPYLKPQSSYLIRALVYQGERDRWREKMYIDDTLMADVYIDPKIPRMVNIVLPKASFGTDLEINKEIRRILGRIAIVADLKVYEVNLPDTTGGKEGALANREDLMRYALYQNRPNPFKDLTKISFALPRECDVSLFIYDIMGRRVRTLIDGKLQPGNYNYTWYGKDNRNRRLTQGVYFYRLQTEDFKDTKKTVLLK